MQPKTKNIEQEPIEESVLSRNRVTVPLEVARQAPMSNQAAPLDVAAAIAIGEASSSAIEEAVNRFFGKIKRDSDRIEEEKGSRH